MTRRSTGWFIAAVILFTVGIVAGQLPRQLSIYHSCLIEHPIHVPEDDSPLCQSMTRYAYVGLVLICASVVSILGGAIVHVLDRRKLRDHGSPDSR
jgi:hypothetical protein